MAVSAAQLRSFLRAGQSVSDDELAGALEVAQGLLERYVGGAGAAVPVAVLDRCQLEVAAEVQRGSATRAGAGGGQFDVAQPAPAPRSDPLSVVYPKLRAWVVPF